MCYAKFIGIKGLRTEQQYTPVSGLYIEDLVGLSLRNVAQIANYESGAEFLLRKIEFTTRTVAREVVYEIPNTDFNKVLDISIVPTDTDNYNPIYPAERGVVVRKPNYNRQQVGAFMLRTILIKTNTTIAGKQVKLITPNSTTTFTVDLVAGEVFTLVLPQPIRIADESFSVVMDNSDVETAQFRYSKQFGYDSCSSCNSTYKNGLYTISNTNFGIAVDFSYVCEADRLACVILPELKDAVLFRTGAEIYRELLASQRLDLFTINSKEFAEKQIEELTAKYNTEKLRIMASISRFAQNLDNYCFSCGGNSFGELIR